MKLNILNNLPQGLLDTSIENLHRLLGGPTIIHLEGEKKAPIFFSTLLHGNEHSGFLALQNVLKRHEKLERSIIFFIGNTEAASKNLRHLPGQLDFNRIWSGGDSELSHVAQEVVSYAQNYHPLCSVDIHNNTGKNPFYSCINCIDDRFFFLANFFSSKIVYFTEPHEVQSMAFSKFTPSITIEAGTSGEAKGVKILEEKIEGLLKLEEIPTGIDRSKISVFHTFARMRFAESSSIDFLNQKEGQKDFSLLENIDGLNFQKLQENTFLGYSKHPDAFWVQDDGDREITSEYFRFEDGAILVKKPFVPAMMTQNLTVIRDDCFGYMMEEYPI